VHAGPGQVPAVERRLVLPELFQLGQQAAQGLGVETGADLARVGQLAVGVVVTEQQGAERDPGPLRVGVPADDELLVGVALELQPVPAPAGQASA
jgi:hypothetical protein